MDGDPPLLQILVFTKLGEKCLDYNALQEAWKARVSPLQHVKRQHILPMQNATKDILTSTASRPSDRFVTVSPSDYSGDFYSFQEEDDGNETVSFGDNDVKMEYADRHPGTSKDSDLEEGSDAYDKYPYYRINDVSSPITTTASKYLFSVVFDAPNESPLELKAAYKHQISLRIDEARQCLNLDCFEYKPSCINVKAMGNPPLPTNGELEKFHYTFQPQIMKSSDDSDSDDEDEETKEWLNETFQVDGGKNVSKKDVLELNYQGLVGNFVHSRCLRIRLHLPKVTGIRLMASSITGPEIKDEGDIGAVLILETKERLDKDAFASRMVRSKLHGENAFALTSDWTMGQMASKATRFYFYGNLVELKQTAALIAKICPHLAAMFSSGSAASNSLRASVSVEYGLAKTFAETELKKSADGDQKSPAKKKIRKMTVQDVHQALIDAKLVGSLSEAEEVNPCLKKAILLGYINISPSTTGETVIHEGYCVHCEESLECTLNDALFQPVYGGNDGGEDATVKCGYCTEACGGGNYITDLCNNNANFDSGKFHNHCTECPEFGICIGDYREDHCKHCNKHYFRGSSGFSCPNCGGGKCKSLSELPPPPSSAWDGKVENAMEVCEAIVASEENPMKRAMLKMELKMMMPGPRANNDGTEFAGLVSAVANQIMGENGSGEAEEDCSIM